MRVHIYQIHEPWDDENCKFMRFESLKNGVYPDIYKRVWAGDLPDCLTLEDVYNALNRDIKPEGYAGHSLSVSDVIAVTEGYSGALGLYYVNDFGFVPINGDMIDFNEAAGVAI